MKSPKRMLVVIGGHEDREGEMRILREVAGRIGDGKLCVATVASARAATELWHEYEKAFRKLGVRRFSHWKAGGRRKASSAEVLEVLDGAKGVFFTGGDQLKITSEIGGTPIEEKIRAIYQANGVIAGTSAGASIMSDAMLVSGPSVSSYRIGGALRMAPGLGFVRGVLIDQHFTERGRIGRLLGALAHNPKYIGIGLDEDTAIVVENERTFRVIGNGGVYVVDAHGATDSNISDADRDTALSLFNVQIHLLSAGDRYDLVSREPRLLPPAPLVKTKPPAPTRGRKIAAPKKDRTPHPHGRGRRSTKSEARPVRSA